MELPLDVDRKILDQMKLMCATKLKNFYEIFQNALYSIKLSPRKVKKTFKLSFSNFVNHEFCGV